MAAFAGSVVTTMELPPPDARVVVVAARVVVAPARVVVAAGRAVVVVADPPPPEQGVEEMRRTVGCPLPVSVIPVSLYVAPGAMFSQLGSVNWLLPTEFIFQPLNVVPEGTVRLNCAPQTALEPVFRKANRTSLPPSQDRTTLVVNDTWAFTMLPQPRRAKQTRSEEFILL
jgi:hypothetical protein